MKIEFSPQRRDVHIDYTFDGEVVSVTVGPATESYDFTGTPDGEITEIDKGSLPDPVVLQARRDAGELTVVLILSHGHVDSAPVETRFPNNPYTPETAAALLAARNAALEA